MKMGTSFAGFSFCDMTRVLILNQFKTHDGFHFFFGVCVLNFFFENLLSLGIDVKTPSKGM